MRANNCWLALNQLGSRSNDPLESLRLLEHARNLRPDLWESHNVLGEKLHLLGRVEEAAECFAEAVRLVPQMAQPCENFAAACLMLDRNAEAVAPLRAGIALLRRDAGNAPEAALSKLALALGLSGQYDEAEKLFAEAAAADPRSARPHEGRGRVAEQRGNSALAEQHYRSATKLEPAGEAAIRYGLLLARRGAGELAAAAWEAAAETQPEARARLAWLRATAEKPPVRDVAAAVRWTEVLPPGRADGMGMHARFAALAAAGRSAEALAQADQLLPLLDGHPLAARPPLAEFRAKLRAHRAAVAAGQPLHVGPDDLAPLLPLLPKTAIPKR